MSAPDRSRSFSLSRGTRQALLWTGAAVLLVAVALPSIGLDDLRQHLARLDVWFILVLLGLSLANYLVRGVRWHVLARVAGLKVPLARNILYYVAGFAFGITPGKIGEVVRLWLLRRRHGVPYERTVGLLVLDRLTDAAPLLAVCFVGVGSFAGHSLLLVALAAMLAAGFALLIRLDLLAGLVKLAYGRIRRRPRLFARALSTLRHTRSLTAPGIIATALVLGLIGWSAEILGAWLVLDRLGADVSLAAAAFVFGFGMLVGGIPLFPGGVGGAEGTMIALLLLLGVDTGTAITATAIIRLATLGFAVVLGFVALPLALAGASRPVTASFALSQRRAAS